MKKKRGRPAHCSHCQKLKTQLVEAKEQIKCEQNFVREHQKVLAVERDLKKTAETQAEIWRTFWKIRDDSYCELVSELALVTHRYETAQKRLRLVTALIIALGTITIIRIVL